MPRSTFCKACALIALVAASALGLSAIPADEMTMKAYEYNGVLTVKDPRGRRLVVIHYRSEKNDDPGIGVGIFDANNEVIEGIELDKDGNLKERNVLLYSDGRKTIQRLVYDPKNDLQKKVVTIVEGKQLREEVFDAKGNKVSSKIK